MNIKKVLPWILGGVLTVFVLGLGGNAAVGYAAEKDARQMKQHQMHQDVMQDGKNMMGQIDHKMMEEMMKDPAMMKQCMDMMQQPEMQSMMKDMMQKPEMQAMMKGMMQKDGQFHKMMMDLVNSVDMDENHDHTGSFINAENATSEGHEGHHS